MIYLLPTDRPYRPEIVQKMKDQMRNIQAFYAEQMAAHGYGNLAFRYETDAQGQPMVHKVDAEYPDSHYLYDTPRTVLTEIEMTFDLNSNVYLIVIDNSKNAIGTDNSALVAGVGYRQSKNGGYALVSDEFGFREAAHELGHAFGLHHDFSNWKFIMSYGWNPNRLSACHAKFLSVHPYFNADSTSGAGGSSTVELVSSNAYPEGTQSVQVRLKIGDSEGVHQVLLFVSTIHPHPAAGFLEVKACRGAAGENDTVVEFDYDGVVPSNGLTDLSQPSSRSITFHVVDADGNVSHASFTLVETSPHHTNTFRNTAGCSAVSISPDFTVIAAGGNNRKLQLWDVAKQELISSFTLPGWANYVTAVSFSHNGMVLAAGGWDWAAVWDVRTQQNLGTFRQPENFRAVNSVAISPNGRYLAAGGDDGTMQLWDVVTERNLAASKYAERVNSVVFSRNGAILAASVGDTVQLWDVQTQRNAVSFRHTSRVSSAAFSNSGTILAAGVGDSVQLWNVNTHQEIATLGGNMGRINSVSFSPSDTVLVCGLSSEVQLWDLTTRVIFAALQSTGRVRSVMFSAGGRTLASVTSDGTVDFWDSVALMEKRSQAADEVHIPDSSLRAAVADAIGVPPNAPILRGQMANLVELRIVNASISDLTGLESATNLKALQLAGNNISEISLVAGLANLPKLTDLDLGDNGISDISALKAFTNLTILRLGNNQITDISALAGLTNLVWLILKGNPLSDISAVSGLTNLTNLTLGSNSMLDIAAVADLINLRVLDLENNNISDISAVSGLTNLTSLNLSENNISDISSLGGMTNLDHLWLFDNNIADISVLSGLTNLQWLLLENNSIRDISALIANSGLGDRDSIFLKGNPLDHESLNTHIPTLKHRGVKVYYENRTPTRIRIVSGNDQQGQPGTPLDKPFVVEVRDQFDQPLSRVLVTFSINSGGGTLSAANVTTNSNGRAMTTLTLGPNPGTNSVIVSLPGRREHQTFNAEGIQIPKKIEIISGNDQQGQPGTPLEKPFVVEVRDDFDKPIQGVKVEFSVTGGGGTLSAANVTTNSNGRAMTTLTLGPNPGTNTVTVAVNGPPQQRTFTAKGLRIPKKIVLISGDGQQGRPGETLEHPFVVEVRDESDEPVQNVQVRFVVAAGGGTLTVTRTAADENGRAETTLTLGSTPGANTVRVTVEGYSEAVAILTIEAEQPPTFTLSIPRGTHAIHIPLRVSQINGVDGTIETVGDVYDALGDSVRFIITIGKDGNWISYLGGENAGGAADAAIGGDTGLIAVMKSAATLALAGDALGSGGNAQIDLSPGNNLVGVPLDTGSKISGLLVEGVAAIAVSKVNGKGFYSITKDNLAADGPLMGGVGYIVVATGETSISIQGTTWNNDSAAAAPPPASFNGSQTPVLYVEGGVMDEFGMLSRTPDLRVTVKNLSTGASLDTVLGTGESRTSYSSTFVEFSRRAANVGDVMEITAHSSNPCVGVRPVSQIVVSAEEVLNSRIVLPDLELYEIPSETELLANYPNPFNPETWIPYRLAKAAEVSLEIYDTNGRLVRSIDIGFKPAAVYDSRVSAIYWDGRNNYGERVASGAYFYHLFTGTHSAARKMLILK